MRTAPSRSLVYLVLAGVCYVTAAGLGQNGAAFALFLLGGVAAELILWRHIYLRLSNRAR